MDDTNIDEPLEYLHSKLVRLIQIIKTSNANTDQKNIIPVLQSMVNYIDQVVVEPVKESPSNDFLSFSKNELALAGLLKKDSDYGGMLGEAVLELVEVFSKQGHSGYSSGATAHIFNKLVNYEPLTPLTFGPDEWIKHEPNLWQNKRQPDVFTEDQGKTWVSFNRKISGNCSTPGGTT